MAVRVPKDDLFSVCLFCLFVLQRVPCFTEIWESQSLVESILSPLSWNLVSTEVESVLFLGSVLSRCSHLMISRGWRELSTTREKWLCYHLSDWPLQNWKLNRPSRHWADFWGERALPVFWGLCWTPRLYLEKFRGRRGRVSQQSRSVLPSWLPSYENISMLYTLNTNCNL